MRQYHYNFLIDRGALGIGRAACSFDPYRVEESDYKKHGYLLGLKDAEAEDDPVLHAINKELLGDCDHNVKIGAGHGRQGSNSNSNYQDDSHKSLADGLTDLLKVVGLLAGIMLFMCLTIFIRETCKATLKRRRGASGTGNQEMTQFPGQPSSYDSSTYSVTVPSHEYNAPAPAASQQRQKSRKPRGAQGPIDFQLSRGRSTMEGSMNT